MPDRLTVIGIRHGEVHNPDGVIYAGLPGYGLSELGRGHAQAAADELRGLPVVAVYASPLERAVETASAIAAATGVPVTTDERLYEWRFWSGYAGWTWDRLRDEAGEIWTAYAEDPSSVTGDEPLHVLAGRMASWLDDVRATHADGLVVGVSHLEPLRAILLRLTGRPAKDLFGIRVGLGESVRLWPDPSPDVAAPSRLMA